MDLPPPTHDPGSVRDLADQILADTRYDRPPKLIPDRVLDWFGEQIGKVVKVEDYGAAPLLVVKEQDKEHLIPLTQDICPEVDTANKKIVVNLPEGLLDL